MKAYALTRRPPSGAPDLRPVGELKAIATEPAPTDPGSAAAIRRVVVDNAYSLPRVVGTCAMGPSPELGAVVDALGRVHGVSGLAVIDASIIPEPPSGFPHVITLMIAEHVSEKLAAAL